MLYSQRRRHTARITASTMMRFRPVENGLLDPSGEMEISPGHDVHGCERDHRRFEHGRQTRGVVADIGRELPIQPGTRMSRRIPRLLLPGPSGSAGIAFRICP